ncbi:MAG: DUF454 domain-containing protein [Clostridiales bacterium]|nr:DUF454 domain-containing protein [Clostridiales bacterium]
MSNLKKVLYISIGLISFALGAIGTIVPILPTVPFLLLSSFCFTRGSERFNKWFVETKVYKKHLESFVNERAMTLKQKIVILAFADTMLAFPLIILDNIWMKLFIVILIIFKFYYFIYRIKTIRPERIIKR